MSYLVCSGAPESWRNSREGYLRLADWFNQVGEACRQHGLRFGYHNHAREFDRVDGTVGVDLLMEHTDPALVLAELDVFWVEQVGFRATDYVKKYAGRCDLIHIKDMTADDRETFAEVGYGRFDIPDLVATAVQWLLVEQDVCERDSMDSVTRSY
ncbi:MAG: TIM barrel protein [Firmicutes bacterium]|nr:TIM barrel protein [Bacillota bacterium]